MNLKPFLLCVSVSGTFGASVNKMTLADSAPDGRRTGRAKSIKNKARVNAELSAVELKALLKKAQRDASNYQSYVALLEAELAIWRQGGKVDQLEWASMERAIISGTGDIDRASAALATPARNGFGSGKESPNTPSRPFTPINPSLENIREIDSRPETPTVVALEKDEREEFLRRENDLTDQLADKV